MALNQFPYTNFHELNGDYVLQTVQQASQDAAAAAQSAQAAASQVAGADQKATEALARATIANNTATGADTKATQALTQAQSAQAAAEAAAEDAQTAQDQVAGAQAAAQAAQTAASGAEQSAFEASRDAAEAIQTAEQALAAIPTSQTMTARINEIPTVYAQPTEQTVSHLLNLAYPAAIPFEQISGTNFRCPLQGYTLSQLIALIRQGVAIDAVITFGMSEGGAKPTTIKLALTYCETANNSDYVRFQWLGFSPYPHEAGYSQAPILWVLTCISTLNTPTLDLRATLTEFDLTPLQIA